MMVEMDDEPITRIRLNPPAFPSDRSQGMMLRDYFAAASLQGILACPTTGGKSFKQYASDSYEMADAMLKARNAD